MLTKQIEEDSFAVLARRVAGNLPRYGYTMARSALESACYGVNEGRAHLRIENRVLFAGLTVLDEVANAAFFYGLMTALPEEYGDVTQRMSFDDAKGNFHAAARHSLRAQFTWLGGKSIAAAPLILDHLLPLARTGLQQARIHEEDIARYLEVIEARVKSEQNGALWMLRPLLQWKIRARYEQRHRLLTAEMLAASAHQYPRVRVDAGADFFGTKLSQNFQTVGQR
ncbi:MAG: hypothetical protein U0Y68_01600 [Blastocatellia bacterium]